MRKLISFLVLIVAVMGFSLAGVVLVTRSDQTRWPDFDAAAVAADAPAVTPLVIPAYERDYGWRTADVIPILIFIKQQPETVVDLHSLAVEGDFDIITEPDIVTRDFADGSRWIRVRFKIQSMKVDKQLALKTSMLVRIRETGKDQLVAIPAFMPYTSPTWDGRDMIQDGDPEYQHGLHNWVTLAYVLGGIVGILVLRHLRRKWLSQNNTARSLSGWETRRQIARRDFDIVWEKFENGDYSSANYQEVARIIRTLFLIECKVRHEIEWELGGAHPFKDQTLALLDICGKVLYQQQVLKEHEQNAIKTIFDQIVPARKQPEQVVT